MNNSVVDSSLLWIQGERVPSGKYKRMKAKLEEKIKNEPTQESYLELARLELSKQNYRSAIFYVEHALHINPTDEQSQLMYAQMLEMVGECDRAKSAYRTYITLHPESHEGYREYGRFLLSVDEGLSTVQKLLLKSLDLEPKDAYAHTILAEIYLKCNRKSQAELHMEIAVRYLGEEVWVHQRRAHVLMKLERYQEAVFHYKKALKNDRKNVYLRKCLHEAESIIKHKLPAKDNKLEKLDLLRK